MSIIKLEVPVIVRVGEKRLSLDDVLSLGSGAIVELDKSSEEHLSLLVNNIPVGKGEAVKVGENFGLRITAIGSQADRVLALGGQGAAVAPDDVPTEEEAVESPAEGDDAQAPADAAADQSAET